ncbi:MAG TPA: pyridoxal 5'-phosphate synthase glutaminase subunit PdxT [Marinilabiliales bacterium]|jgi:5'-phosphate synthase pdxT subunit|nr:MAG: glutamine amidotransferase subunit PdxT [Bacteroidetes bacterium GWA2_40_14]OFX60688.1 MAG: glutamine amidotransferase subunit PdxT [Bacteroidetes bacterium GWC2_40_13]OFX71256.1 MAG: glutamine amidotransferase subunit PdxT [Bacteroidetes bacterium GWD2_40_43]OFX89309.1 MAG: glutamine amidotransferase subunit PdxT [Bacteroidetes bacterium GWE2_40_63]OFY23933.1 MAG: glutamine amidotransferase subunit PdxT [Bacteroidetes bacterium GWF2_40_13]OFZ32308.1 MAG: glutamine amidotransferase sub
MTTRNKIGVLDLQGGVHEHIFHLQALGIEPVRVKVAEQFDDLAGLILPGGESTCLIRLLNIFEIAPKLREAHAQGMKIWGTCAGAILIANHIEGDKSQLGLMDITVSRNAFGYQIDSFNTRVKVPKVTENEVELTFIRAPKITAIGSQVQVLLQIDDYIAAAESDSCLATVFHPELTPSLAFHKYFVEKCGIAVTSELTERPDRTSWMKFARIAKPTV